MRIEIEQNQATKASIIALYSDRLELPAYLHENWDSFEECLNDVQISATERLEIVHVGWTAEDYSALFPYRDIVEQWAESNDWVAVTF